MGAGLVDGHLEDFVDVATAIFDLQQRDWKAAAFTNGTGDEDIGEKLHLDFFRAGAVAAGTAARATVEGEIARTITLRAGGIGAGEKIANGIVGTEIERGIGGAACARGATDRRGRLRK